MTDDQKYEALNRLREGLHLGEPVLPSDVGISEVDAQKMGDEGLIGLGYNEHINLNGGLILAEIPPKGRIFLSTHSRQILRSEEKSSRSSNRLWDLAKILLGALLGYFLARIQ
jgi:hypothetical protein